MDSTTLTARRRRIGVSTILVGLCASGLCAVIIVPGAPSRVMYDPGTWDGLERQLHGWPLIFEERSDFNQDQLPYWSLTEDVVWWSPSRLAIDVGGAVALCALTMWFYESWRRYPRRFTMSLRTALIGTALMSAAMAYVARWVAQQFEIAHLVVQRDGNSWNLTARPAWLNDWKFHNGSGLIEPYMPRVMLQMDDMVMVELPTCKTLTPDEECGKRLAQSAPGHVRLDVTLSDDPDGLLHLNEFRRCEHLHVGGIEPNRAAIEQLFKGLPNLVTLDVGFVNNRLYVDSRMLAPALAAITSPRRLKELTIRGARLNDNELVNIQRCSHLESLRLAYCDESQDIDLHRLERLSGLRELRYCVLECGEGSESGISGLEGIARLSQLKVLVFRGCKLDEADVKAIASLEGLRALSVSDGTQLTRAAYNLLDIFNHLISLDVTHLYVERQRISALEIKRLRAQLPSTDVQDHSVVGIVGT